MTKRAQSNEGAASQGESLGGRRVSAKFVEGLGFADGTSDVPHLMPSVTPLLTGQASLIASLPPEQQRLISDDLVKLVSTLMAARRIAQSIETKLEQFRSGSPDG